MDAEKIISRLESLEAAANLIIIECRKTRTELEGKTPKKRKPYEWTAEKEARVDARLLKSFIGK